MADLDKQEKEAAKQAQFIRVVMADMETAHIKKALRV